MRFFQRVFFSFFFTVLMCYVGTFFVVPVASAQTDSSASAALTQCQDTVISLQDIDGSSVTFGVQCSLQVQPVTSLNGYELVYTHDGNTDTEFFTFPGAPPSSCAAGTVLPVGTAYNVASSSGSASYQGCCLALSLVPASVGAEIETGATCGATGAQATSKPSAETSNPDGSKTYCELNSGDCVTYNPNAQGPAPASSSANNTTSSTSTTTPASSSSSGGSGSGSGSGTGTGSGSGSGGTVAGDAPASSSSTSCTTGVCDVGNADGNVGTLYTPSTDSPGAEYAAFQSSIQNAPVIQAVNGFFTLNVSGSCPTWNVAATKYWPNGLSFDQLCQSAFTEILGYAGDIVLAVAAFAAFKIALY